mmetsp:Transcript_55781/g.143737  ORF Transcript_55781/g.143737 Transcript_55781/m.143737 type:complete len:319 (+) Transcript_55781:455-1411(+)
MVVHEEGRLAGGPILEAHPLRRPLPELVVHGHEGGAVAGRDDLPVRLPVGEAAGAIPENVELLGQAGHLQHPRGVLTFLEAHDVVGRLLVRGSDELGALVASGGPVEPTCAAALLALVEELPPKEVEGHHAEHGVSGSVAPDGRRQGPFTAVEAMLAPLPNAAHDRPRHGLAARQAWRRLCRAHRHDVGAAVVLLPLLTDGTAIARRSWLEGAADHLAAHRHRHQDLAHRPQRFAELGGVAGCGARLRLAGPGRSREESRGHAQEHHGQHEGLPRDPIEAPPPQRRGKLGDHVLSLQLRLRLEQRLQLALARPEGPVA